MAFEDSKNTWQPCRRSLANGGRVGRRKRVETWRRRNGWATFWLPHWLPNTEGAWHGAPMSLTYTASTHDRHCSQTNHSPISSVRLDSVASRLKWAAARNRKRNRMENRKELLAFYWSSAINRRIILMNWWLPSGPSHCHFQCTALVSVLIVFQNVSHWFSLSIFVFAFVFFAFLFVVFFIFNIFEMFSRMRCEAKRDTHAVRCWCCCDCCCCCRCRLRRLGEMSSS